MISFGKGTINGGNEMNILVISQFDCSRKIVTSDFIPRVGDRIDMFCRPLPIVSEVIAWPSEERLQQASAELFSEEIDAIVIAN